MTIREQIENREYEILSGFAAHAKASKGRQRPEEPCDVRTCFQRDRDRILHTKSFRRMKNKTQVFLEPEGDHYRTRLTHTLEVSQIARTIGKALRLNEDLIEAIALGHDLGHTPFGHSGEAALDKVLKEYGYAGFNHNEQSVRLAEKIEKDGRGMNLTWEVLDGILNHGTRNMPSTLEGKVVRFADKIAYIHHDTDDAIRAGVLSEADIPEEYTAVLGHSVKARLNTMVHDVITQSMGIDDILYSEEVGQAMAGLRGFLFKTVYQSPVVKQEEEKAKVMLEALFRYYMDHPDAMPASYKMFLDREDRALVVSDYISGMTDQYAVWKYEELFVPKGWKDY
ncbi:MAG: deoxyguanosinetriphosphate triphosphohydrolase [Lachnospiraceae bacterium]|nr:deoxyguanosinetriphosphate triphosphohydrolase [Lachnospiraceae bacterium]